MRPKIALQLWSIQKECQNDFLGTLTKVKEMGYSGVEFAGYYGMDAESLRRHLDSLGLKAAESHIPYEELLGHFDEVINREKTLGNSRIVCPYANFATWSEWQHFFKTIQKLASKAAEADMEFIYHNHVRPI